MSGSFLSNSRRFKSDSSNGSRSKTIGLRSEASTSESWSSMVWSRKSSLSTLNSATFSQIDDVDFDDAVGLSNVNVVIRVRPLSNQELKRGDNVAVEIQGPNSLTTGVPGEKSKTFTFSAVLDEFATQQDVLDQCGMKQMIDRTLEGYACTTFAYGQTGSGKTHTITGPWTEDGSIGGLDQNNNNERNGLIQRSFIYLFEAMKNKANTNFTLCASYLEIYNEQVIDLLNPSAKNSLPVRWSKDNGFYVENLFVVECETLDDLLAVLEEGMRQKAMGTTNINEHSSRSHTIMTLFVDSETSDQGDDGLYLTKHGKIIFVDLAGSEKVKELGSSSELLSETTNINKSLLTLGNCISSLGDNRKRSGHIPYRDSKLTKLLADSLGGNGITLMIACISPSSYCLSESLNTLRYANRAKRIKNKPVVRMDPREKLIMSLKREVKLLRAENQYLRGRLDFPGIDEVQPVQQEEKSLMSADVKGHPNVAVNGGSNEVAEKSDGQSTQEKLSRQNTLNSKQAPASAADDSLYEMIQEYMVENETLRTENADLQNTRERSRREQQQLYKENDKLVKKLSQLERVFSASPISVQSAFGSRMNSGQSMGSLSTDPLSPFKTTPNYASAPQPQFQPPQLQRQQPINQQYAGQLQHQFSTLSMQGGVLPAPLGAVHQQNGEVQTIAIGDPQQQRWSNQMSPTQWRQSPGQLPPVDTVKGVPDGFRSAQQQQRDLTTHRSLPTYAIHQQPNTQLPLQSNANYQYSKPSPSYGQQPFIVSTPPMKWSSPPMQRGLKTNISELSQTFPLSSPGHLQQPYGTSPMAPLQEETSVLWNPLPGQVMNQVMPGVTPAPLVPEPQPAAEILIPSLPTNISQESSMNKDASLTPRAELKPIQDAAVGSKTKKKEEGPGPPIPGGLKSQAGPGLPIGGHPKAVSTTYKAGKPSAVVQSSGYGPKSQKRPKVNGNVKKEKPAKNDEDTLLGIPRTPSTTPPAIRYKPSGTSKLLAASTTTTSKNGGPHSDSLKEINHKLREELDALDGEIEYMKYMNKSKVSLPAKGKKR